MYDGISPCLHLCIVVALCEVTVFLSCLLCCGVPLSLSHLPLFFVFYFIVLNWHIHAAEYAEMVEDGNSPMLGTRQAHC